MSSLCGKRSFFSDDNSNSPTSPSSSPFSKKLRFFCSSPSRSSPPLSAVDQLRAMFPDMDKQYLERALEESGYDIESAIKNLHNLHLGYVEGNTGSAVKSSPDSVTGVTTADEILMKDDLARDTVQLEGAEWVELLVREMQSATSTDDARSRATRVLESLEKSISARATAEAEAAQSVHKWLTNHPKFLNNPLYVSGLSYSGVTVPIIVQDIFNGNDAGNVPKLNIKGYMIGNPLMDRFIDFNSRIQYAKNFALLSDELYESTKANCNGDYINVSPANGLCKTALAEVDEVDNYELAIAWATDEAVQKALHVRELFTNLRENNRAQQNGRNATQIIIISVEMTQILTNTTFLAVLFIIAT